MRYYEIVFYSKRNLFDKGTRINEKGELVSDPYKKWLQKVKDSIIWLYYDSKSPCIIVSENNIQKFLESIPDTSTIIEINEVDNEFNSIKKIISLDDEVLENIPSLKEKQQKLKEIAIRRIKRINESTNTIYIGKNIVDDGPVVFAATREEFIDEVNSKIDNFWSIVDDTIGDHKITNFDPYDYDPFASVSVFPKGIGALDGTNTEIQEKGIKAYNLWKELIAKISERDSWSIKDYLGADKSIQSSKNFSRIHHLVGKEIKTAQSIDKQIKEGIIISKLEPSQEDLKQLLLKLKEDLKIKFKDLNLDTLSKKLYQSGYLKIRIKKDTAKYFNLSLFLNDTKINFNKHKIYFWIRLNEEKNTAKIYIAGDDQKNKNSLKKNSFRIFSYIFTKIGWKPQY